MKMEMNWNETFLLLNRPTSSLNGLTDKDNHAMKIDYAAQPERDNPENATTKDVTSGDDKQHTGNEEEEVL